MRDRRRPRRHRRTERATRLELVTRAGEIDFEEFLLVIKNMQNPGAVQSKLGPRVGVISERFRTSTL